MKISVAFVAALVAAVAAAPAAEKPKPVRRGYGQTYMAIGQNYLNEWNDFSTSVGKKPAGISVYGNIFDGVLTTEAQEILAAYGAANTGYVELGLSWKDDMMSHGYTQFLSARLQYDIANGVFDQGINRIVDTFAQYPNVKYIIRPDYEVSGNLHANTNPTQFDQATWDLKAYPAAYRHVRDLFKARLNNVEFIFHPVRGSAETLYPGDDVVDYQGFSIFNNDVCVVVGSYPNTCQDPNQRVDVNVQKDLDFARKPKWIAESGAQPPASSTPEQFIDYLSRVRDLVEMNDFAGWTYINSLWTAHGWDQSVWGDSRVEARPEIRDWFMTNIANNPRYQFGM